MAYAEYTGTLLQIPRAMQMRRAVPGAYTRAKRHGDAHAKQCERDENTESDSLSSAGDWLVGFMARGANDSV